MRIAFCDDEEAQVLVLQDLVEKWRVKNCPDQPVFLDYYESGEAFLFDNPTNFPFDVILLDIQMDQMDGIELARKIRMSDTQVILAFLTNSSEHVFQGYEVLAARYLMKPLQAEKVFELLDFVAGKMNVQKQYMICNGTDGMERLEVADIVYIEAEGHYVTFVLRTGIKSEGSLQTWRLKVKTSFSIVRQRLAAANGDWEKGPVESWCFMTIHRSYMVNLKYVDRIGKNTCILGNGDEIPISRVRYNEINDAFIRFYKAREGGLWL